jgi:hypothetical protein
VLSFAGGRFSCLPSIQRKPSVAEELMDLGKSDTTRLDILLGDTGVERSYEENLKIVMSVIL